MSVGNAINIAMPSTRAAITGVSQNVNGTANVTLASLAYTALVAGTYRIEWALTFNRSGNTTTSFLADGRVDGTPVRSLSIEQSDTTNSEPRVMITYANLTAGAHTIDLVARGETAATTIVPNSSIAVELWST